MENTDLKYIKTTLEYLRDNTEVVNQSRAHAETFFNTITNSLNILNEALVKPTPETRNCNLSD